MADGKGMKGKASFDGGKTWFEVTITGLEKLVRCPACLGVTPIIDRFDHSKFTTCSVCGGRGKVNELFGFPVAEVELPAGVRCAIVEEGFEGAVLLMEDGRVLKWRRKGTNFKFEI